MNDWDWDRDWNGETRAPQVITGQVIAHTEQIPAEQVRPYEEPVPNPREEPPGRGHTRSVRPPWVRPSRRRRIARLLALLLCALLLAGGGTYAWADFELDRAVDLGTVPDRPPQGKGTTYLIVGSDSRDGLSEQARKDLHAGGGGGGRTDSMILLHSGAHGTTMVSLPRDSWVTLPAYLDPGTGERHRPAKNKLNAAYSLGGARLLVRTVELNTGIRVDHYAEIGFGGFVGVVNAVGGLRMCVDRDIKDQKSGLDLTKGCHTLDGAQALAFVRQRHQEAQGDLGRSRNQRKLLAALAHKAATPATALDPFRIYPLLSAALDTLVVDKGTDLRTLASLFQAMRSVSSGDGRQLSVPVTDRGISTSKGDAVEWNASKARKVFSELRDDQPVSIGERG